MTGVDRDELRTLFLFASLDDEQLDWLAARGSRRTYDTGTVVYREGDVGRELFVLLTGGIRLSRLAGSEQVVTAESSERGVYGGAVRAYVERPDTPYSGSMTTTAPSSLFVLPASDFSELMHAWFPMAVHLLDGLYLAVRTTEATVRQREHLASLGTLSANLAHELNNPAAAAVRATEQLRGRVAGMRSKLAMIASGRVPGELIGRLVAQQEAAVELSAKRRHEQRSPVEEADLEDALADRLDGLGISGAYDLAGVLGGAGLDVPWVDQVVQEAGGEAAEGALRWLAYTVETEQLMDEVQDATGRISTLVAAVKQYSYMDSAAVQEVDVHAGIDSTVVMLGHRLQGVQVVRDYDLALPRVPAYGAELNQVWTNLLDNAAHAAGRGGTVRLRTARDGDDLLVEVADDGPGIPPEVQDRVYDPFFTTKPPGEGSGLGLENALRIVQKRHHGTLSFTTGPHGTTFAVRLPLQQQLR